MNPKNILLLGAKGFLGSKLHQLLSPEKVYAPSHQDLDLLKISDVYNFITTKKPDLIIYTAGITKIDFAEVHSELTFALNYFVPEKISRFASKINIPITYISTDAVFDGYKKKYEFSETDIPKTKSVYGSSKLKGEEAVMDANSNNCVIRLITLYGIDPLKTNFVAKMLGCLKNKQYFLGIEDQIQNPLFVDIAAEAIEFSVKHQLSGIYHLGALDYDSNYNLLVKIATRFKLDSDLIQKITFNNFMGNKKNLRKRKSVLLCDKFVQAFQRNILQTIDSSIQRFYETTR